MFKYIRISLIVFILFGFLQVSCFAEGNINFLTPADEELYRQVVQNAHGQKMKNFKDKIDFYDTKVKKSAFEQIISKETILYIDQEEFEKLTKQSPTGLAGSLRVAHIYSGLGLTNIGYKSYSQNFCNLKVTYVEPPKNCIVIKPEILSTNWLIEERGGFLSDMYIIVNFVIQITITDHNKIVLSKIYKNNGFEISLKEFTRREHPTRIGFGSSAHTYAFALAMNSLFQKNIKDIFMYYN